MFNMESFVTCNAFALACAEAVRFVNVAFGDVTADAESAANVVDPENVLVPLTVRVDRVV